MKQSRKIKNLSIVLIAFLYMANAEEELIKTAKKQSIAKELHQFFMPYFWILFSNGLIYIVTLRHNKNNYLYHGVLFGLIILITFSTSVPILIDQGFISKRLFHYIIGVFIWILMIIQLSLGIFQYLLKKQQKHMPSININIRKMHKIIGIIMYFTTKISIIERFKKQIQNIIALIIWEACFLTFIYWNQHNKQILNIKAQVNSYGSVKKITSINDLKMPNNKFGIYLNYVFNISSLAQIHPGGKQMIQQIYSNSFDKYLYGIENSYAVKRAPPHQHSKHFFSFLKMPIAILDIKSPFKAGFQEIISTVKISEIRKVSENLFQIRLKKIEGFQFEYQGYTNLNQFGRFYTLQSSKNISRLYSVVNFLTQKNISLIKGNHFYKESNEIIEKIESQVQNIDNLGTQRNLQMSLLNQKHDNNQSLLRSQQLSLLIKKYDNGHFTSSLQQLKDQTLNFSCQCGQGLGLDKIPPGRIVIFVGGTGIFPFCDLIDILYQDTLMNQNSKEENTKLIRNNKILQFNAFRNFSFEFYGSFQKIEDIHYITANQIAYLCRNNKKFSFLYNLKVQPSSQCIRNLNINQTSERFENILMGNDFKQNFSKIFVCGPQKLRKKLYLCLRQKYGEDKYKIL